MGHDTVSAGYYLSTTGLSWLYAGGSGASQNKDLYDLSWGAELGVFVATWIRNGSTYRIFSTCGTDSKAWSEISDTSISYQGGGCVAYSPDKKVFCIVANNISKITADCETFLYKQLPTGLYLPSYTYESGVIFYSPSEREGLCWSSVLGKFCLVSLNFSSMYTLDINE